MTVQFQVDARVEYLAAIAYYEEQRPGLGQRFVDEIGKYLEWIERDPETFSPSSSISRRANLQDFPYSIHFSMEPDGIRILAVAHHKRRADYWRHRRIPE